MNKRGLKLKCLLALGVMATLAGSMLETAPAQASSWQAWIPMPAQAACPSGAEPLSPTSASTDSLGVVHLHYSFPNFSSALPPKGFRAASESSDLKADLFRSGLLTKQAERLAKTPVAPQFCVSSHIYADFGKGSPTSNSDNMSTSGEAEQNNSGTGIADHSDGNWAGYSVDGGTGFNGVAGSWSVGTSKTPSNALQPSADDTWIGVGGDLADCSTHTTCSLIQEGTEMRSGVGYQSWFEFLCTKSGQPCPGSTSVPIQYTSGYGVSFTATGSGVDVVRPGDVMSGNVYWVGTTEACFTLDDNSRSTGSISGCASNEVPYDAESIEWVDEDAWWSSDFMADFGQTSWTAQSSFSAGTGQTVPISSFNNNSSFSVVGNIAATEADNTIVPDPGCNGFKLVAYPYDISSAYGGSSQTVWCSSGPPAG